MMEVFFGSAKLAVFVVMNDFWNFTCVLVGAVWRCHFESDGILGVSIKPLGRGKGATPELPRVMFGWATKREKFQIRLRLLESGNPSRSAGGGGCWLFLFGDASK